MARTSDYAFAGVALLAIVAPFELTAPLVRLPGQSISDLEVAMLAAFLTWGGAVFACGARPEWRTPLTAPWLALLIACGVAAVSSQVSRVNALHMTGRLGAAFGVYLLTANAITTRARVRAVLALTLGAGVLVSALAVLEYLQVPAVLRFLTLFRPGLSTVGAQVRAGGPLQYPTIASMYLEIVFAFGVGLLVMELEAGHRATVWLVLAALVLVAEAITVTFTRAGVITAIATLAIAAAAQWRRRGLDGSVRVVGLLTAAVIVVFFGSRSPESIRLRWTTEGQAAWYRAAIHAPDTVAVVTGRNQLIPLSVTNVGRLVWNSQAAPPIYFSYHWLDATSDRVVAFEGVRTPFDRPVSPGETVSLAARVRAPDHAGAFRISWDLVQDGRLWFTTEPGAVVQTSRANVSGDEPLVPMPTFAPPRPTTRPGRFQLWRAALAMFATHPVVGVGPDNFRLSYGRYAGIATPDPRTHSNNMYLELLADTGLVGAAAFAWLLWATRACKVTNIGVVCALVAIALHGLVDSFLSFGPTYVLFALTLGLACAEARGLEIGSDAHRV